MDIFQYIYIYVSIDMVYQHRFMCSYFMDFSPLLSLFILLKLIRGEVSLRWLFSPPGILF